MKGNIMEDLVRAEVYAELIGAYACNIADDIHYISIENNDYTLEDTTDTIVRLSNEILMRLKKLKKEARR